MSRSRAKNGNAVLCTAVVLSVLITTVNVIAAESKFEGELEPFMTEPVLEMQQV